MIIDYVIIKKNKGNHIYQIKIFFLIKNNIIHKINT